MVIPPKFPGPHIYQTHYQYFQQRNMKDNAVFLSPHIKIFSISLLYLMQDEPSHIFSCYTPTCTPPRFFSHNWCLNLLSLTGQGQHVSYLVLFLGGGGGLSTKSCPVFLILANPPKPYSPFQNISQLPIKLLPTFHFNENISE